MPAGLPLSTAQLLELMKPLSKLQRTRLSVSSLSSLARVCQIAPTDTSPSTINCWLSAPELQNDST
ncbi:hypothetical protein D3C79_980360 [compost metagenome]